MSPKKPTSAPRVFRHEFGDDYLKWMKANLESVALGLPGPPPQHKVKPDYVTVIDGDRRYVEVSGGFCDLVGYATEELLAMRYHDLTAPNTNDIPTVLVQFLKLGYLHGLWMSVSRAGTRILVR